MENEQWKFGAQPAAEAANKTNPQNSDQSGFPVVSLQLKLFVQQNLLRITNT